MNNVKIETFDTCNYKVLHTKGLSKDFNNKNDKSLTINLLSFTYLQIMEKNHK